jgi:anaerobic C4-dicarboxylate transporter
MPVGIHLGLGPATLVAFFPAVNGYFFLPTYATIVAAVAFDTTGTTKIGRYVLNHSFMRPGLVATAVSLGVGYLMSRSGHVSGRESGVDLSLNNSVLLIDTQRAIAHGCV